MFKITNISSPSTLPLEGIDFRDLNKRFGKYKDFLELQVLSLNNELLSTFNITKSNYQIVFKDKDNLTDELKVNFQKALKENGFEVGKFNLILSIQRNKVFRSNQPFNIKEISPSRKELRVTSNTTNQSLERGVKNYIAERDSSPFFKDFILKFNNEDVVGINVLLNDIISKY